MNGTGCLTRIPVEREQAGSRHGGGEGMAGMPERPERFDRTEALHRLRDEQFDVLVVGGGITGAGVALDAAARGLSTALVDKGDFGSGTSSASSKLVHGGLRYLQQYEVGLVFESLSERQTLLRTAPHLVQPLDFVIPLFGKGGVVDKTIARTYSLGLWIYDLFGDLRIGHRHQRVTASEVQGHLPTLRLDRLVAGFLYYDAHADDARFTLAITRTAAVDYGIVAVNHAPVLEILKDTTGRIYGARVTPEDSPIGEIEVRSRVVVNATGVWADELRDLDILHTPVMRPAKGIHVAVPNAKLPCDVAVVLPSPSDGRNVFIIPWGGKTYVGTTDTAYDGDLDRAGGGLRVNGPRIDQPPPRHRPGALGVPGRCPRRGILGARGHQGDPRSGWHTQSGEAWTEQPVRAVAMARAEGPVRGGGDRRRSHGGRRRGATMTVAVLETTRAALEQAGAESRPRKLTATTDHGECGRSAGRPTNPIAEWGRSGRQIRNDALGHGESGPPAVDFVVDLWPVGQRHVCHSRQLAHSRTREKPLARHLAEYSRRT